MEIHTAGENSVIVYANSQANTQISMADNQWIKSAKIIILAQLTDYLIDIVPSYSSLLIIYNDNLCDHFFITAKLRTLLNNITASNQNNNQTIELPVLYDSPRTTDLTRVSEISGLSINEIISIHQSTLYTVFAIGFAPGFAFLGEVDKRIATPRLPTPRTKVPKGAVAIADQQTAIYPAESPGGWNLIGLCPSSLFSINSAPPMPFNIGDNVKFTAISHDEFLALGGLL